MAEQSGSSMLKEMSTVPSAVRTSACCTWCRDSTAPATNQWSYFAAPTPLAPQFEAAGVRTLVRPLAAAVQVRRAARATGCKGGQPLPSAFSSNRSGWPDFLRQQHVSLVHLNNSITRNHPWMMAALFARSSLHYSRTRHQRTLFAPNTRPCSIAASGDLHFRRCARQHDCSRSGPTSPGDHPQRPRSGIDVCQALRCASTCRTRAGAWAAAHRRHRQRQAVEGTGSWSFGQWDCCATSTPTWHACSSAIRARGERDYLGRIEALVSELGLAGRIKITGYRSDVADFVAALDIQVHASIAPEPFGRVLLEAMALSKPLVASGGGAVPEIVVDGETGLLFEPGAPEDLARCMRRLLDDPDLAARMGRAGYRSTAEKFSITANVRETQDLYDSLAGSIAVVGLGSGCR